MLQRRSGRLTVILKQQDVLKPAVLLKIENAVAKCPQHVFNPFRGQGCETGGVVGSFDNHFMRPDTVHPVEHSFGLAVQRAFNAEGGKLVRYHPRRPPWCGPLGGWSSIRSWTVGLNLRRCLTFVAIAKGAESALQLHILSGKIAWALGSIRGNNHPAANNRIFSQLRHSKNLFIRTGAVRGELRNSSICGWLANGHSIRRPHRNATGKEVESGAE